MFSRNVSAHEGLRVLLVEDHVRIRQIEFETLENLGYAVDVAATASKALELLAKLSYDLVITDVRLPGELNGIALAQRAKQFLNRPKTLVVGAHLERYPKEEVKEVADAVLTKPFTLKDF